jgi:hypothetical protein
MVNPRSWALALVTVLIAFATLLPTSSSGGAGSFCLLCGERGLADFISNVALFSTFGVAMALRGSALRLTLVAGALFSGAIEVVQIDLISGRDANVGDLVANIAGTAVGWLIASLRPWRKAGAFGPGGSALLTAVTCGGLLLGLLLLSPVLPPTPYYLFWTPEFENQDLYRGSVLATRLGPLAWQRDYVPMEPAARVRRLLQTDPLVIRFLAGPPPRGPAPIVSIQTEELEIIQLGAIDEDFVYSYWGAGDVLRMDHGVLRLHRALEGVQVGDTVELSFAFDKRGYCIDVNGRSRCGAAFTVGDTWTVLVSTDWSALTTTAVALAWLWVVFLPCGYFADSGGRVLAITIGATISLVAAPMVLGFAVTPWHELIAVALGILSGHSVARSYQNLQSRGQRVS